MASVFELSEPYRNHLVSVLPPGRGVCAICWTAVDPGYPLCYPCRAARDGYGRRLAEVVAPIALVVKRQQLAHELWHYKYDADATVRRRLEIRLASRSDMRIRQSGPSRDPSADGARLPAARSFAAAAVKARHSPSR